MRLFRHLSVSLWSVNVLLLICHHHIHSLSVVDLVVLLVVRPPGVTIPLQTAISLSFREAPSLWCSVSTDLLPPVCQSWAVTPKCGRELWMSSGTRIDFPVMVAVE